MKKEINSRHDVASLLILCGTLLPSLIVAAAESDPLSEALFFDEIPVVLSATRLSQPITDTPAAITVIDRKMIEASGAVQLVDLLRLVPGFQIGYFTGSKFTASYHGNADRYARDMQVLVDGRSIYDPAFGGVTWSSQEVEIDEIDRIEVIRGPNAASYGSNSFSGIINIITIHPSLQQGVQLKTVLSEKGNDQFSARYSGTSGALDYRFTLRGGRDTGFEERYDTSHLRRFNFRGDYQVDNVTSLQMGLGFSNNDYQDGFIDNSGQPLRSNPEEHNYQHLRWRRSDGPESEYVVQFYHNHQVVDDDYVIPSLPYSMGFGFTSDRYDLEFEHTLKMGEKQRIVWGLGARQDQVEGIWTFATDQQIKRNQLRAFANTEWNPQ